MTTELLSATQIATDFLAQSGHLFSKLEKAVFDEANKRWTLTFSVGLAENKTKKVVIDDSSGKVVQFD